SRAKGVSAKPDKADLTFSCKAISDPPALIIRCDKRRSVRCAFHVGDEWIFERDTQRIESHAGGAASTSFRPTVLMEAVSKLLEGDPGLSKNGARNAVKGKNDYIDLALELLVSEQYVERRRVGQADRYYSQRAFRGAGDD